MGFPRDSILLLDPNTIPRQFDDSEECLPVGLYRGAFVLGLSNAVWKPDFNARSEPIMVKPDWDAIGCVVTLQVRIKPVT